MNALVDYGHTRCDGSPSGPILVWVIDNELWHQMQDAMLLQLTQPILVSVFKLLK